MKQLYKGLIYAGRVLFERGLVDTRSGNISARINIDKIIIKKSGENMGDLRNKSFVITYISKKSKNDSVASSDLELHRKIYIYGDKKSKYFGAVVHSHPPEAIALSHIFEEIEPRDHEARLYVQKIKFVEYTEVPEIISEYKVCVSKFHGVFCAGKDIQEALLLNLITANSLKIAMYEKILDIKK
ncbi:MAG: class II aldolase/adducin family protein [Candidatus Calescibacterium sp.]|nr:class II aldolase/adducin family protein [Candidatus Calescibacterium sp.]MCX7734109.1 class II aldolase/adducin family protein [bacterium]MDW8087851.1 class II aldolase/adducin family protein [Candidatus Calescibacterium sp.]